MPTKAPPQFRGVSSTIHGCGCGPPKDLKFISNACDPARLVLNNITEQLRTKIGTYLPVKPLQECSASRDIREQLMDFLTLTPGVQGVPLTSTSNLLMSNSVSIEPFSELPALIDIPSESWIFSKSNPVKSSSEKPASVSVLSAVLGANGLPFRPKIPMDTLRELIGTTSAAPASLTRPSVSSV